MKSFWEWIGANDKQLKAVFTVVAAVTFVWQYHINVRNQRVAQASDYFVLKDRAEVVLAQFNLGKFRQSQPYKDFCKDLLKEPADKRETDYDGGLPSLIVEKGYDKDVYTVVRFYEDLGLCVKAANCDPQTICNYFFSDVQNFREDYRPVLQSFDPSSTNVIDELAEGECSASFFHYCDHNGSKSPYCRNIRVTNHPSIIEQFFSRLAPRSSHHRS
jgi:hypothetical protein